MKITIPCLFNNPEKNTHEHSELGIDVPDSDLIERNITFYNIDCLVPRISGNKVSGTIIYSGRTMAHTLWSMKSIEKLIDNQKYLSFKN